MGSNMLFVDQTLGYVLKNRCSGMIAGIQLLPLKEKIADMKAAVIFDIPVNFLAGLQAKISLQDVRAGVDPWAGQMKLAHDLGCNYIKINYPYDPSVPVPEFLSDSLAEAAKQGMQAAVCITDIEKCIKDMASLKKLVATYPICSLIVDDTGSRLDSLSTYWALESLRPHIACKLEYHGGNALGLASGNALGAVQGGVDAVAASVGGLGGYPALEEVLMGMKYLLQMPIDIPNTLAGRCKEIMQVAGQTVACTKPIIGVNIFAHESGIHVDGVSKKSELYEPFSPEAVGLTRKIVIGKHSGKAAIELKLRELNIILNSSRVPYVLERVRGLATQQKAPVSDLQLRGLANEVAL